MLLYLVRLVSWLLLLATCSEGLSEGSNDTRTRRLWGELARRLKLDPLETTTLEGQGLLPRLDVGGFRLRETFALNRTDPFRGHHAVVPGDYIANESQDIGVQAANATLNSSRRLNPMISIIETPMAWQTPRDIVRFLAALNAASLPDAAYTGEDRYRQWTPAPATKLRWEGLAGDWSPIYDDGLEFYTQYKQNHTNLTRESPVQDRVEREMGFLKDARAKTRTTLNVNPANGQAEQRYPRAAQGNLFRGIRGSGCAGNAERCRQDIGTAMSVYEDATRLVLVFHDGWDASDFSAWTWHHRIWILERFELYLNLQWVNSAQQVNNVAQDERRGEEADEVLIRCAYNTETGEEEIGPVPGDAAAFAAAAGVTPREVENYGFWNLIKLMVRTVLPEWRDRKAEKNVILTGAGSGGVWAALASMWLNKIDDVTYSTYIFAPSSGWQCMARTRYTTDVTPWLPHSQIFTYAHVMDTYALSVDKLLGYVCLYGYENFTQDTPMYQYCDKFVGMSGPQIFYRGVDELAEEVTLGEIRVGRKAFDACHYFTHSIWYAGMILSNEFGLQLDGSTDGGCYTAAPIEETDPYVDCPGTESAADEACLLLGDTSQPMPWAAMGYVMIGLTGFICSVAACGYLILRRARNDKAMFALSDNSEKDKAEIARERARARREKEDAKREAKEKGIDLEEEADEENQKKGKKYWKKNRDKNTAGLIGLIMGRPQEEYFAEQAKKVKKEKKLAKEKERGIERDEKGKKIKDKKKKKDKDIDRDDSDEDESDEEKKKPKDPSKSRKTLKKQKKNADDLGNMSVQKLAKAFVAKQFGATWTKDFHPSHHLALDKPYLYCSRCGRYAKVKDDIGSDALMELCAGSPDINSLEMTWLSRLSNGQDPITGDYLDTISVPLERLE